MWPPLRTSPEALGHTGCSPTWTSCPAAHLMLAVANTARTRAKPLPLHTACGSAGRDAASQAAPRCRSTHQGAQLAAGALSVPTLCCVLVTPLRSSSAGSEAPPVAARGQARAGRPASAHVGVVVPAIVKMSVPRNSATTATTDLTEPKALSGACRRPAGGTSQWWRPLSSCPGQVALAAPPGMLPEQAPQAPAQRCTGIRAAGAAERRCPARLVGWTRQSWPLEAGRVAPMAAALQGCCSAGLSAERAANLHAECGSSAKVPLPQLAGWSVRPAAARRQSGPGQGRIYAQTLAILVLWGALQRCTLCSSRGALAVAQELPALAGILRAAV